jgi:hypothetical protein
MRTAVLLLFISPSLLAQTQPDLWKNVSPDYRGQRLESATPSNTQLQAIGKLLHGADKTGMWGCEGSDLDDMIQGLMFNEIPLAANHHVLLVQAGQGCGRGGQGANGAMWLIRLDGDVPVLLASPEDDFNGWLYSIQPSISHGYHDLVLGWHMGASYAILTYFQFDGKSYNSVSRAADTCDDKGCRIDPNVAPDPN